MDSRTGIAGALGVVLVTVAPVSLAVLSPSLLSSTPWVMAVAAALGCAVASTRTVGLERAGWCLLCAGTLVAAGFGLLLAHPDLADPVAGLTLHLVAVVLVAQAMACFAVTTVGQVPLMLLHVALLSDCLWLLVWRHDPLSVGGGEGAPAVVRTAILVGCLITTGLAWLLVVPARRGHALLVQLLVATGLLAASVGDVVDYLAGDAQRPATAIMWTLMPSLVLGGALLAALRPSPPLQRSLVHPGRDLVISSVVTLASAGLVYTQAAPGLDTPSSRALCIAIVLLVVLHLNEGHHSRQLASSVEAQARHMQLLVSETRDIIIELDEDGRVRFVSAALSTILGLRESDLTGKHISDVLPDVSPEVLAHLTYAPTARLQSTLRLESALTTSSATVVHVESVITPLPRGYLVAVRDVTERVGLQSRLQQVTYHDVVTGLPNRTSLDRAVRHRLYESATGEISLLLLDIAPAGLADNTVGDDSREELLRSVARTIRGTIRTGDVLARFSDQRFAVLLRQGTDEDQAEAEAERIVGTLNRPELVTDVTLRTCGGLCVGGHTGLELVRNAELAVRQATREGPGTVRTFDPSMLAQYARTRDLRRRLARPPGPDRWTVLYQPIVNLRAEQVSGVEALLRWTDPEGDFIGIEEVIRLAEEFGSIISIGTWVLEQAVDQAMEWYRAGHPLSMSVNISVHQLVAPGFADTVQQVLDRSGLPPDLLILEITETVVLEQTEETVATLEALRELGIRVAIDDFGTGYSGLANLRSLPLDILKIDRSFVQGLGEHGGDEAVVAAVSRLGRELALTITAEGIETRAQEARARMLGISAAQGYLYARPLPAAQILHVAHDLAGEVVLDV